MAKYLISLAVLIMSIVLLSQASALPITSRRAARSTMTIEINKTLKEGLDVLREVLRKRINSTRTSFLRNTVIRDSGLCQVVDYVGKIIHNSTSDEGAAATFYTGPVAQDAAEAIVNNTCTWINGHENIIETCSIQVLELLCIHSRIYAAWKEAVGAVRSQNNLNQKQWIVDNIAAGNLQDFLLCVCDGCPQLHLFN